MSVSSQRWAIVGGGILGMTLALRLAQQGKQVTLYESAHQFGGLASAWRLGNILWDRHYHVTLLSDTHVRSLLTELGLEQDMQWVETKTGFFTDGKLYSMSNTLEFLSFPALRFIDKLRLGFTIWYASKVKNWKKLEKIPVATWLRKLSGDRTFEKIWLPLLRSKLGENYHIASASFIWAIIARMYAARRTGLKKEMFGYLPGGYARLLSRFVEVLSEHNVELKVGHRVSQVIRKQGQVQLEFTNGQTEHFDEVVLTMASPIAAQVCKGLSAMEYDLLRNVEYQGIICASLLLKKPLASYYVTNITDTWVPFTGVIEMSALVDRSEFDQRSLVYLPKYVSSNDPAFGLTDEEIQEEFIQTLVLMYPKFDRNDVVAFRVSRVRQVFAISTLNYSEKLPPMHTSVPGVHIINSAHIPNGTLNVNETVLLAEKSAVELLTRSRQFAIDAVRA
ncbi:MULTISPECIES: NAD(P)/FAD-dependent oxidoreductase [Leptolyngbya]|uniref:NAD(P)/FAD-dependent oxidoreductase n=1 Tax=Leptolyngbya TaxID=47251 RepID=UPI001683CEFE|nr:MULTISPECIES: NAD(P)/FAD-dependent oxidoreductase [unclassified Leptolyngbya]MBD1857359.1 NAD(P)/FAD-dependent oxidoreductase [Leptolyngbya sp. FACHB-1624]MCY6493228.1 NAD(P)/FAD-dependent oxidoreductase [Leptolyngbya sp. GGD]